MTTTTIIQELERLPLNDKLLVIERTLQSIRIEREKSLADVVDCMYDDYKTDRELTVFTQLDKEPFYETR
ncbi:MAG: hypothetical protein ABI325_07390 [Ginsengibacter sp.]